MEERSSFEQGSADQSLNFEDVQDIQKELQKIRETIGEQVKLRKKLHDTLGKIELNLSVPTEPSDLIT